MKSLRDLYKIGKGPSSSHTIGPERAAKIFMQRHPAPRYRVILYGSLGLTGRGHLTDKVLAETLPDAEIVFSEDFVDEHPNTLDLFALDERGKIKARMRAYSIGGGSIRIENEDDDRPLDVYPHASFKDVADYCRKEGIDLPAYVRRFEPDGLDDHLARVLDAMDTSIREGIDAEGVLPGDLGLRRKAGTLYRMKPTDEPDEVGLTRIVSAYAFAVSETNASGGTVVTAPTCGASGVLPAVLRFMRDKHDLQRQALIDALAVGGIIGNIVKHNASISGAEAGCQAEIGTACSMAAAMHAFLRDADMDTIEYAAEVAMEHHLGLTCDPVLGYVQIPCIERNAVAALRAMDASNIAYFSSAFRKISFDLVVETMHETGRDLPKGYRETSTKGLAKKYRLK